MDGPPPPRSRRQRRDLSLDEIVAVAAGFLVDRDDDELTMRQLAEACGVTPMAIYHHVADKETLLTHVVDRVLTPLAEFDHSVYESPSEALVEWGALLRRQLLSNRGAATTFLRRPILSANQARLTERMFEMLRGMGLDAIRTAAAADAIVLVTMGSVTNDLTRPPHIRRLLLENEAAGDVPLTAEHLARYAERDGERSYRTTVGWILDGVRAAVPNA